MRLPWEMDGKVEVIDRGKLGERRCQRRKAFQRVPGFMPDAWMNQEDFPAHVRKAFCDLYKADIAKANAAVAGVAAAAATARSHSTRHIVEFCCSDESRISNSKNFADGLCHTTRITEKVDGASGAGARAIIKACKSPARTLLWCAIPCTGGCAWNVHCNSKKSHEAMVANEEHVALFKRLWKTFEKAAAVVHRNGGRSGLSRARTGSMKRFKCSSPSTSFARLRLMAVSSGLKMTMALL